MYQYPSPRTPDHDEPDSIEDVLPHARALVQQERSSYSLGPVENGDRLLVITLPDQNVLVRDAVTQALEEEGAETVEFVGVDEILGYSPETHTAEDGWREADLFAKGTTPAIGAGIDPDTVNKELYTFLDDRPDYTGIYYGYRPPGIAQALDRFYDKFRGKWLLHDWKALVSDVWALPDELMVAIGEKSIEPLDKAAEVRLTDPEGTHLEFSLTPEEAAIWKQNALSRKRPVSVMLNPRQCTSVLPDMSGVLAGTSNLMGFFPRLKLHFEDGKVVEVEGGGRYGAKIRELLVRYQDIQWPGYPEEGFFWTVDATLKTTTKGFRRRDIFETQNQYPLMPEYNRSGVLHLGFGSVGAVHTEEIVNYADQHDIPLGHIHVHNYFATFEIQLRGTNKWIKIVDKGRPTALDDPHVRAKAAEHGDPDELLEFDWRPRLPGINSPGDYEKDYAPDPAEYVRTRLEDPASQ